MTSAELVLLRAERRLCLAGTVGILVALFAACDSSDGKADPDLVDTADVAPDSLDTQDGPDSADTDTPDLADTSTPVDTLDTFTPDDIDTATPQDTDTSDTSDVSDTADTADTQVLDPDGDSDQDGVLDLDEVADGTDPFDPRSCRSLRPDIVGHPRLYTRPADREMLIARAALTSGPAKTLWDRAVSTANRAMPAHPGPDYDTSIPPPQGQIAEAAALVGYVTGDLAMTDKALDVLAAPFPDPTPLNRQSLFNAGDHYNLLESEALTGFCTAYDLAAGTPGVDPAKVAAARSRLIERVDHFRRHCMTSGGCTTLLRTERNNHSLKSLSALGVCAMAIPDHPKAVTDFHDAFGAVHYLAHDFQGDPEGGWAESWNYLNYSGETHLSFHAAIHHASLHRREPGTTWLVHGRSWLASEAASYGRVVEIPAPTHDPLWRAVYLNAVLAAQPDGRTVPVDDGNPSPLHGGLLAILYDAPALRWNWDRVGLHTGRQLASTFLMFDPDDTGLAPTELDIFLKNAGFSVLRSTTATTASFFHMQHELEPMRLFGSSHEHADPLSFILWARGEPLAIDPGYIDFTNHGKVKYGKDHNIVLVDGQGPEFFLDGLIQAPPNSDGFLHDHTIDGHFTTFAASTKYAQAEMRRRVVRLARASALSLERDATPDVFVIGDTLISETSRLWTFQLNGLASESISSTSFTSTPVAHGGYATWVRPNAALHAVTTAMVDPTIESRLEENSLASASHRCFTVSANMGTGAGFLTVLVPVPTGGEVPTLTSRRLAPQVLELEVTFAGDRLVAWLHTGTVAATSTLDTTPVAPGLTVRHDIGGVATRLHYTMALPAIPDPSPFIP